ncbi:hypothetical protein AT15_09420 [Kosmotoga arenicorallina S304]|uniref:Uncharacterized protein n=1 Tax=Kosmotoga arenicorallina S304 TaxID=1453497 RepID=A0A176K1A4_9BACT|nr:hypothetical protein AT15_09420 [Kosmotoga arenicorallina S304]
MKTLSSIFFSAAIVFFFVSLVFFEIGTRKLRKAGNPKLYDKRGIRFLLLSIILAGVSLVLAFI